MRSYFLWEKHIFSPLEEPQKLVFVNELIIR